MRTCDADPRRLSWRRVLLLIALGASSGLAFTRPGQWAAWTICRPLHPQLDFRLPLSLEYAMGKASRECEAFRALGDMCYDGELSVEARAVPEPARIAERLARIDGWSTAVLFEAGTGPGALYRSGIDDIETCGRIIGAPIQLRAPKPFDWSGFPIHQWSLVLLDEQGRRVAGVGVSALRPGFKLIDTEPDTFVPCPSAPGDGDLPAICIFRRSATGEVTIG